MEQTDFANLFKRIKKGEDDAFKELLDSVGPLLFSIAHEILERIADAQDAVEDTYKALLENLDRITKPDSLRGWLRTTVRRKALDIKYKDNRILLLDDKDLQYCINKKNYEPDFAERSHINSCLARLSEIEYQALMLSTVEEKSCRDIMKILKVKRYKVYRIIKSAKENFKKFYYEE